MWFYKKYQFSENTFFCYKKYLLSDFSIRSQISEIIGDPLFYC